MVTVDGRLKSTVNTLNILNHTKILLFLSDLKWILTNKNIILYETKWLEEFVNQYSFIWC